MIWPMPFRHCRFRFAMPQAAQRRLPFSPLSCFSPAAYDFSGFAAAAAAYFFFSQRQRCFICDRAIFSRHAISHDFLR
jgi:hypothetical protein